VKGLVASNFWDGLSFPIKFSSRRRGWGICWTRDRT